MNKYLNNGDGLYRDEEGEWDCTWWNVELHKSLVHSDHFHVDHKEFYSNRIDEFRVGVMHGDSIGEKDMVMKRFPTTSYEFMIKQ